MKTEVVSTAVGERKACDLACASTSSNSSGALLKFGLVNTVVVWPAAEPTLVY